MTWSQAKVLIVSDELSNSAANALTKQLVSVSAETEEVTYQQLLRDENYLTDSYSHFIAILPQTSNQKQETLPVEQMIQRLKTIATAPNNSCIAYVQFGGGYFGSGSQVMNPETCCAAGFARSVHLERSDMRVRVLDMDPEIPPDYIAELAIAELSGTEAIATVGYNDKKERLVPQNRLQQPVNYNKRALSWSEEDVILVTGGAKGITAECALELGKHTNAKMALVGRSQSDNQEVARTLERFKAEKLTCRYYSCDLTNPDEVTQLVETVTTELDKITGVVHGAGMNKPRRVEQVSLEEAIAEVSPKLIGASNLLQALASKPPKLFIAFSSIIGVTGMPGNAWYAFANESLVLRRFEREHQETQVLSLAYSV